MITSVVLGCSRLLSVCLLSVLGSLAPLFCSMLLRGLKGEKGQQKDFSVCVDGPYVGCRKAHLAATPCYYGKKEISFFYKMIDILMCLRP